ncbi:hypothetical protein, partial [Azotobacter salinestris]
HTRHRRRTVASSGNSDKGAGVFHQNREVFFRISLDMTIGQAVKQGLIELDASGDLYLTAVGKHYAVQHNLIRK